MGVAGDAAREAAPEGSDAWLADVQRSAGNTAVVAWLTSAQAKLDVGAADDGFEREADVIAAHVVEAIHRTSDENVDAPRQVVDADLVGRRAESIGAAGGPVDSDTERTIASARGGGRALPGQTRERMESAFGADFSKVRVHTGPEAETLNRKLQARAFTVGSDIFFKGSAPGGDTAGDELLAHELTHTIQQSGTASRKIQRGGARTRRAKAKAKAAAAIVESETTETETAETAETETEPEVVGGETESAETETAETETETEPEAPVRDPKAIALEAVIGKGPMERMTAQFGSEAAVVKYADIVGYAQLNYLIQTQKLSAAALQHYPPAMLKIFVGAGDSAWDHVTTAKLNSRGVISGAHDEDVFFNFLDETGYDLVNDTSGGTVYKVTYMDTDGRTMGSKTLIEGLVGKKALWLGYFNEAIWNAIRAKAFRPGQNYLKDNAGYSYGAFYKSGKAEVDTVYPA